MLFSHIALQIVLLKVYQKGKEIPRQITNLNGEPTYRAVALWFFPGMYYPEKNWKGEDIPLPDPKSYTIDGKTILYHNFVCYGPYSTPGTARGRLTKEVKYGAEYYGRPKEFLVYEEVEASGGDWKIHPKPVK